ncbi:unnamed protein product [Pedinophyceae sp. YPF-701]|nr:unnamed protein product [Pedinophyceae sp. YPF-701]
MRAHAPAAAGSDLVTDDHIALAHRLADTAGEVTRKYFRNRVEVDHKGDDSPVTIADRQAEEAMRALIHETFPDHGVFGEEHGLKLGPEGSPGRDFVWVLDPIDGTKSFITGKPLFGTLIALTYRGRPVLGVIDQSITRERWLGVAGRPSTLNGEEIATRPCDSVAKAYLYATTPDMFQGASAEAFSRVAKACRIPMYGCDCYAYGLLAAGLCDLVVEADLKPYDYMALVPIVEGAGGRMTDWRGSDLVWLPDGMEGGSKKFPGEVCAAGDARSHAEALALLAWEGQ